MNRRISLVACVLLVLTPAGSLQAHEPYRVEFTTSDGVVIIGDYWTPIDMTKRAPAVILLHMYRSDRSAFRPLVPALEEAGFAVLTIDMRGHGESVMPEDRQLEKRVRDRDPVLFRSMNRDVFGAYRWLQHRPEVDLSRVAVVGASVGCSVALDYASRDKSVDVVVLMTPGKDYLGLDSIKHIQKYGDRPMLMLTSEEERSEGADALVPLAPKAEVKTYDKTGIHGTRMFGQVAGVEKLIAEFLEKHVGQSSGERVYASVRGEVYHLPDSIEVKKIKDINRRLFSSAAEAEQRGLRPSKN